jgi:alpha-ribazole phosphatase
MTGCPPSACRIILARHATAAGNGTFLGQRDTELTADGKRELPGLWRKCREHSIDAVYSSDLRRARQTAEAVARKLGLSVQICPDLREMHFGEWEGLTWNQIARRYPKLADSWVERFPYRTIPGAEPLRAFRRRIAAAIERITEANRGRCALVITHAGVIRFTLAKALGLPVKNLFRLQQDHCALNVIDYFEDGALVQSINA